MLKDLVLKNRSYRSYAQSPRVELSDLKELVELARITPSSQNKQALRYRLVCGAEECAVMQPLTGWAKRLHPMVLPPEGHCPTAFIVICSDPAAGPSQVFQKDVGIVAQTMLLGAAEKGFGGCMIGSFTPEKVREALSLPEELKPELVVAFGYPDEEITLVDCIDGDTAYYRDAENRHYVPKLSTDELIIK